MKDKILANESLFLEVILMLLKHTRLGSFVIVLLTALPAGASMIGLNLDYHVTWTKLPPPNPNNNGVFTEELDLNHYDPAFWYNGNTSLRVDNQFDPSKVKHVYLEIDYAPGTRPSDPPVIQITGAIPFGDALVTTYPTTSGPNDWNYHWYLRPQPFREDFTFPSTDFFTFGGGVVGLEVGTYCRIPEPSSLSLIACAAMAALACVAWRKRAR